MDIHIHLTLSCPHAAPVDSESVSFCGSADCQSNARKASPRATSPMTPKITSHMTPDYKHLRTSPPLAAPSFVLTEGLLAWMVLADQADAKAKSEKKEAAHPAAPCAFPSMVDMLTHSLNLAEAYADAYIGSTQDQLENAHMILLLTRLIEELRDK